jgi:hypothetical protein
MEGQAVGYGAFQAREGEMAPRLCCTGADAARGKTWQGRFQ